jgi:acetyl esterase/lipase
MASSELQPILAVLRARGGIPLGMPLAEARAAYDKQAKLFRLGDDVRVEPVAGIGPAAVAAEWLWSEGSDGSQGADGPPADGPTVLYLHGGAYVMGSLTSHRDIAARLAAASGGRALHLDYRLAPEHPFPAALDDAEAAYRWLLEGGGPSGATGAGRIVLAGDSAGGGLALALLVRLRDGGTPLPAGAVCFSPWTDLEGLGESMTTRAAADPTIRRESLLIAAGQYLAGADPRTPTAAPLWADLAGLPPLLLQVGGSEVMLDDSRRLAARAREAGVAVELDVWPLMFHGWQLYARLLPEGREAIARAAAFVRRLPLDADD